jgi:hypothetical protein
VFTNGLIVNKIPQGTPARPSNPPPPPPPPDDERRAGIRLTKDFAEALFPGKRIASVLSIADKSHGFIYLVILVSVIYSIPSHEEGR